MSSKNAPLGLIIEADDNDELQYIEVPKSDYRSVRNSILELDNDNGQLRLNLFNSIDHLELPNNKNNTKKSIEKVIDNSLLESIPKNIGTLKIEGTIYIPIILVSLILRKAQGYDQSYASQLTKIINEYIVVNVNRPKIATNNLSRELRKDEILDLPWLEFHENGRKPLFSLNEKWKEYWSSYFLISEPKI